MDESDERAGYTLAGHARIDRGRLDDHRISRAEDVRHSKQESHRHAVTLRQQDQLRAQDRQQGATVFEELVFGKRTVEGSG